MSLDEKFAPVEILYEGVSHIFKKMAGLWISRESGMPTIYEMPSKLYARSQFIDKTPNILAVQRPENWSK
jgi:hypothetical protein